MLAKSQWLFILFLGVGLGQNPIQYPADSLLADTSVSIMAKVGLFPIAAWERLSFHSDFLNCQYYPSCSVYGAQAVAQFGLARGSVMAADRTVRCNPAARFYQLREGQPFHYPDGRLVDPVVPKGSGSGTKSPILAAALSSVIPGAGRAYAGRPFDGLMGFLTVAVMVTLQQESAARNHTIRSGVLLVGTLAFYFGEIYGAWRTAKYG